MQTYNDQCPIWTKRFPMILGLHNTDCSDHLRQTGFDVDSSGNFILTGYLKSTSTQCTAFNNGVNVNTGYIMHVDNKGNMKWILTL